MNPTTRLLLALLVTTSLCAAARVSKVEEVRSVAHLRMDAHDEGMVLKHGDGPDKCDLRGARDAWVYQDDSACYLHYDGGGPKGWLACLATSQDLVHWTKKGRVLDFGDPGAGDSASATYGTTYFDGGTWHMFYLGASRASPAPDFIPVRPYITRKAHATSPTGPWTKQPEVRPFECIPGTYYSTTASPGQIVKQGNEYLMFFSGASQDKFGVHRTLGIAHSNDLNGAWTVDIAPILPPTEQIENSSLYYEPANQTWFLFTNHVAAAHPEYTDAIWVYWSKDLTKWSASDKAIVLDGSNCGWSHKCIGLPATLKVGGRLAVLYDAPGGDKVTHMSRDIGLAWLELPLNPPTK